MLFRSHVLKLEESISDISDLQTDLEQAICSPTRVFFVLARYDLLFDLIPVLSLPSRSRFLPPFTDPVQSDDIVQEVELRCGPICTVCGRSWHAWLKTRDMMTVILLSACYHTTTYEIILDITLNQRCRRR